MIKYGMQFFQKIKVCMELFLCEVFFEMEICSGEPLFDRGDLFFADWRESEGDGAFVCVFCIITRDKSFLLEMIETLADIGFGTPDGFLDIGWCDGWVDVYDKEDFDADCGEIDMTKNVPVGNAFQSRCDTHDRFGYCLHRYMIVNM
jgi:hypothetical protein